MIDVTHHDETFSGDTSNAANDSGLDFDKATNPPKGEDKASHKPSKLTEIINLAENECEFWHDKDRSGYASFKNNGHTEHWPIDSRGFREWLARSSYISKIGSVSKDVMADVCANLNGEALFGGGEHEAARRVYQDARGSYWLDMANDAWQAIRVNSYGWEIVDNPPVRFLRNRSFRPFPVPAKGGNAMDLFKLTNIPADEHMLVMAWVLECFRPDTPYPVLELTGEQGSAKSTAQEVLRLFIDNNEVSLRSKPKTIEDVYVGASNTHLLSYENLSSISAEMSDAFCVVSTGGGYASRTLYTNGEETILNAKNPIVLNGINRVIVRPDLLDRSITVGLPLIRKRIDEVAHQKNLENEAPCIFGGILDLFSKTLATLPSVFIDPAKLPRMADFTKLGEAMSRALGNPDDKFLDQYTDHRREAVVNTIDSTPIGRAIVIFIEKGCSHAGTVGELLRELNHLEVMSGAEHGDYWPRSPKGLGNALRRLAPALRQIGIDCRIESKARKDGVHCVLKSQ